MRAFTLAVFIFGFCELGPDSHAAVVKTDAKTDLFDQYKRESRKAYDAGNYQKALAALQRAYEVREEPILHYNMSQCYKHMKRLREEYNELNLYLRMDDYLTKDAGLRQQVEGRVEALRKALGFDPWIAAGPKVPVYKRWWLWSTIGSVAASVAVTAGMLIQGPDQQAPTMLYGSTAYLDADYDPDRRASPALLGAESTSNSAFGPGWWRSRRSPRSLHLVSARVPTRRTAPSLRCMMCSKFLCPSEGYSVPQSVCAPKHSPCGP